MSHFCTFKNIGNLEYEDIRKLRDNITIASGSFMQCEPLLDIIDDANYEFFGDFNITADVTNIDYFDVDMSLTFGVIDPEGMSFYTPCYYNKKPQMERWGFMRILLP